LTDQRKQLAGYQGVLLEILATASSVEDAAASIRTLPLTGPFRSHRDDQDLRMIEVAMQLTRKWGVRKSSENRQC